MLDALGALLPVAVGVALSPIPIIAVVLVLLSRSGRSSGLAFLAGRVVGVFAVVGLFAFISDAIARTESAPAIAIARILLGTALMALAFLKWRSRPKEGEEAQLPRWMTAVASSSPPRSAGIGVLIAFVSPRDLLLGVAAGLTIGSAGLPFATTAYLAAIFAVIASVSVIGPVIAFLASPTRVRAALVSLHAQLVRHNAVILAVVLLLFGANQIGSGIAAL
jgi:threonine/homoserine/homoserine lactone efflux protein